MIAEAWLFIFLLAATLVVGAAAVLATGVLLGESWVGPLRPVLSAASRAAPALILLALPLPFVAAQLYPWPADALPLRFAVPLLMLAALGHFVARRTATPTQAGAVLLLLVPAAALMLDEWALSRDPAWEGSLQGLVLVVGSAAAALSVAVLCILPAARLEDDARTGLERALLALAIGTLWLSFVQFLVVWAADLPAEAAWYARRGEGVWLWLSIGAVLPAIVGAIALGAAPQWSRWRMAAVCALLVLHHAAHLGWAVQPDAAHG